MSESFPWDQLVDTLRSELQEYGGLVGLLAEQQVKILRHEPSEILEVNKSVQIQMEASKQVLTDRERLVSRLATNTGHSNKVTLTEMLPHVPGPERPMFEGLIEEINQLINVARRRLKQNQSLLVKMSEVTDQLLSVVNPQPQTTTYNRKGKISREGDGYKTSIRATV